MTIPNRVAGLEAGLDGLPVASDQAFDDGESRTDGSCGDAVDDPFDRSRDPVQEIAQRTPSPLTLAS